MVAGLTLIMSSHHCRFNKGVDVMLAELACGQRVG